jgi:predicted nucleic acid-binding protein
MKVYLDTCSLQRPLDSKTQIRIVLEAEAVLGVIGLCENGEIELVSSEVLMFETIRNPKMIRREFGREVLAKAGVFITLDDEIEQRAEAFGRIGIKPLDALHLASAETAQADYFCTCDDRFLKKARGIADLRTKVVTPVELIEEIE